MSKHIRMAAVLLAVAAPVEAQLASPSAAALGMGDNYTAAARGYAAMAWNPALLGLAGNPRSSFTLLTPRGIAGLDPVTLADLKDYENKVVPANVKQEWLDEIMQEGSQAGTGGADMTWLALQLGSFGLQVSSSARAVADISPGIAELLMFGNADEQGDAKVIDLQGSKLNTHAFSTAGVSYAHSILMGEPGSSAALLAFGATAKFTMGHMLAISQESTGSASADPAEVTLGFPMVHTRFTSQTDAADESGYEVNNGSGIGLDLGVAYQTGTFTLAATVQNLVNTFKWDEDLLEYREGTVLFTQDESVSDFEEQPFANAPQELRTTIEDMKFKPSFALGALLQATDALRLSADARFGSNEGMSTRPPTQVGAGAEYRLSVLSLRAGAAFVKIDEDNSGMQFGGGVGLGLGGFNISASALRRNTDLGSDDIFMIQLISIGM